MRGYSGDGGPAAGALLAFADLHNGCDSRQPDFEQTTHLFVDPAGNIFFTDSANQRIRRIDASGAISTFAGNGQKPPVNGPPNCENTGGSAAIGDGGPAASARFLYPGDVVVAPGGSMVIADQQDNRVRQISTSGQITTLAGSGVHNLYAPNTPATVSPLDWPGALAIDSTGVVYFAELHSSRVAKIVNGSLVTVAGTGIPGYGGDGGRAVNATLGGRVAGIALDSSNNLYIADEANHRIRLVTTDGNIRTIAGTGTAGFSGDGGPATAAQLNMPSDVKLDRKGNIYIADMQNNRIRRIDASGVITTVAGDGQLGRGPDNVAATASSLNWPVAVSLDSNNDLYIADWQNFLIRKVTFSSLPTISQNAVLNAASFAPSPVPVAPGSIISILGVNFAGSALSASTVPLPQSLGNVSAQINGINMPLYYVSPTQINAQVPFEVAQGPATITVTTPSGISTAASANIGSSAVGVFESASSTRAVAVNQDGSLNAPGNPESRGNVVVVYLTGQGAVNPPGATGQPAPLTSLSYATGTPGASVGGVNASVLFLGLAPGFVGVAQANIQIPQNAPVGDAVVLVVSVGGQASNTTTIAVR